MSCRHYTMDTSSSDFFISVTDEETDLGVVFNDNLKFANHVVTVYVKLTGFLGL